MSMTAAALIPFAAMIYAESANQPYDAKVMVGSSALNRLESGKKEFGAENGNISEVLKKGYYSVSKNSPLYQEAMSGKFKDPESEKAFKQSLAIASALVKGTIERHKAQFFLTEKEIKKTKMNMKILKSTGDSGAWKTYSY